MILSLVVVLVLCLIVASVMIYRRERGLRFNMSVAYAHGFKRKDAIRVGDSQVCDGLYRVVHILDNYTIRVRRKP